jgi:hypothetical protein
VVSAVVDQDDWVPKEIDTKLPSSARIYDYLLGGAHNFRIDRTAAEDLLRVVPANLMAAMNRDFLRRAVDYLVTECGIRQFLDLGSGIPTVGNVHEIAQAIDPTCRVVYVDIEPVAVAHSELLLADNPYAAAVQADMCLPSSVLGSGPVQDLLDLSRPLGLLIVGAMQFVPEDRNPWGMIGSYRSALAPGSYLALSHFTPDGMPEAMAKAVDVFARTQEPAHPRTRSEVLRMFEGFELVEPGLTFTPQWRPRSLRDVPPNPERSNLYAGVGRLG